MLLDDRARLECVAILSILSVHISLPKIHASPLRSVYAVTDRYSVMLTFLTAALLSGSQYPDASNGLWIAGAAEHFQGLLCCWLIRGPQISSMVRQ